MKKQKKNVSFVNDDYAVLGLPLRLTVSLIIGTIALIAILSFMHNPCLFPERMRVSVTPYVTVLSEEGPENVSYIVYVSEIDGHPLQGASIIINGLGGAGIGYTDENGKTFISLQVRLQHGLHEGYLEICVKATCHETFVQHDIIKVVRSTI